MSDAWKSLPDVVIDEGGPGWQSLPDREKPSTAAALARGGAQGVTLGFADEGAGLVRSLANAPGDWLFEKLHPDAAKEPSAQEQYRTGRDAYRQADKEAQAAHPYAYGGGQLAGGVASSFIPGLGITRGAGLAGTVLKAALAGGLAGAGGSEAQDGTGLMLDTVLGAGLGGALGAGGYGLGKLGQRFGRGAKAAEEAIDEMARTKEAAKTATIRSEAGRAGSDTARQLEHIDNAGMARELTPDQALVYQQEQQRLGKTAAENLIPSAERRAEKVAALGARMSEEPEAIATEAARGKSAAGAWDVLGPRLKRYGLPLAGGALGYALGGAEGAGGLIGLGTGAGMGSMIGGGFRPALQSILRAAKDPRLQRPLLSAGSALLGGVAAPVAARGAPAAGTLQLSPKTAALIAALRGQKQDEALASMEGANAP